MSSMYKTVKVILDKAGVVPGCTLDDGQYRLMLLGARLQDEALYGILTSFFTPPFQTGVSHKFLPATWSEVKNGL